ncbi:RNA polymerase II transcription factor SIII subunit A-domain-containing protein [Fimicolochytrium jonesii]|uniref:RNA polymerase II transcription factor SIII subunit A-domain-containing protein n=1 Tax=Fimicolochytrium jonesii TaxID=1396493 RepID=UPI0022FE2FC8|nr:RNA polymerase II transcription factor SIII subunit A-domain-containing protein [Fimicolochytrium jonesii]KAI8825311.1 RNA polymerase II transcription factor SIII subunit A-domain-containing protein [Fimicolochytrium jonesii]
MNMRYVVGWIVSWLCVVLRWLVCGGKRGKASAETPAHTLAHTTPPGFKFRFIQSPAPTSYNPSAAVYTKSYPHIRPTEPPLASYRLLPTTLVLHPTHISTPLSLPSLTMPSPFDLDDYAEETLRSPDKLSTLCLHRISRSSHALKSLGRVPYHLVKEVLEKCNASQLEMFEENSLNILPDSCELWKGHVLSDFADLREDYKAGVLGEPENWRDLYMDKRAENDDKVRRMRAKLRRARDEAAALKDAKKIKIVDPFILPGRGTGNPFLPKNKRAESSILSKARKDAKKVSRHFDVIASAAPSATSRGPHPGRAATSGLPSSSLKRPAPSSSSNASGNVAQLPPAKRPKNGGFTSKAMSSLARKLR